MTGATSLQYDFALVELEPGNPSFEPQIDRRIRLAEPLPVRLVAVEDMSLPTPTGLEQKLDFFYVTLLEFERVRGELSYRADNCFLRFELRDVPVVHESLRPIGVELPSLAAVEKKLIDAEIEYIRQRSITPGSDTLLVQDPAGNWMEIGEIRRIL